MKKTQLIELKNIIWKTRISFFSIVVFVTLGVSIFLGISWMSQALREAANNKTQENTLRDFEILFPIGFDEEEMNQISELDYVDSVEGSFIVYQMFTWDDNNYQARIASVTKYIDLLDIKSGALPDAPGFIAVNKLFADKNGVKIGDTISFETDDISQLLHNKDFTVSAIVCTPMNFVADSFLNGVAETNGMANDALMFVDEASFNTDEIKGYTDVLIRCNELSAYKYYEDGYRETSDKLLSELRVDIARITEQSRANVLGDSKKKLDIEREKLEEAEKELNENGKKLEEARIELDKAQQQIEAGKEKLYQADGQIGDAYNQLNENQEQLEDGKKQLEEGISQLEEKRKEFESAEAEYEDGKEKLKDAKHQITQKYQELDEAKEKLERKEKELEEGEETLSEAVDKLAKIKKDYKRVRELLPVIKEKWIDGFWGDSDHSLSDTKVKALELIDRIQAYINDRSSFSEADVNDLKNLATRLYHAGENCKSELKELRDIAKSDREYMSEELDQLIEFIDNYLDFIHQYDPSDADISIDALKKLENMLKIFVRNIEILDPGEGSAKIQAFLEKLSDYEKKVDEGEEEARHSERKLKEAREEIHEAEDMLTQAGLKILEEDEKLKEAEIQLEDGRIQLENASQEIEDNKAKLSASEQELADGWKEYEEKKSELLAKKAELLEKQKELDANLELLTSKEEEYNQGLNKYKSGKKEYDSYMDEYSKYQKIIEELNQYGFAIKSRDFCIWLVGVDTISNIAEKEKSSLASLFIIVSALICYCAMVRMIYQQLIQIGTKKALGFFTREIRLNYLLYAVGAGLIGSVLGVLTAYFIIEKFFLQSLKKMYYFEHIPVYFDGIGTIAIIIAIPTVLALLANITISGQLKKTVISLLSGDVKDRNRRHFYEKYRIYQKLSLVFKSIINNLVSDKRRVFSTFAGITGCTALMVTSLTLNNNIMNCFERQYEALFHFDNMILYNPEKQDAKEQIMKLLGDADIDSMAVNYGLAVMNLPDDKTASAEVIVPESMDAYERFDTIIPVDTTFNFNITNQTGDEKSLIEQISGKSTEDYAPWVSIAYKNYFGDKKSENIRLKFSDGQDINFKPAGFFEHYLTRNYVIISKEYYVNNLGRDYQPNAIIFKAGEKDLHSIGKELLGIDGYIRTNDYKAQTLASFSVFKVLAKAIVSVYFILSIVMSITVLLTLLTQFVEEKKNDIIIMMINGYLRKETKRYIYMDTIVLSIIGISFGILLGTGVGIISLKGFDSPMVYFMRKPDAMACMVGILGSSLLILVMTLIALRRVNKFTLTDLKQ